MNRVNNLNLCSFDAVIAGAGLSGITAARVLAEAGHKVVVVEKREEVGGNTYDYVDGNGITVQKYGPHIFHTSDKEVFDFLSRFTEWTAYEHRVLGNINGKLVPVPFNLTSLFELYGKEEGGKIKDILIEEIGLGKKVPILTLKGHADKAVRDFADFVYRNVFYIYTMKQWGFKPEELGEAVMNRVPVYISYEDRYFTDTYQYMPADGFTEMSKNILDHENITLITGVDILEHIEIAGGKIFADGKEFCGKLIYTGRTEQLFGYKFGKLSYRSLDFVFETLDTPSYQPAAVVNYNTSEKFTRISEFTKFACGKKDKTVIVKEYSKDFKEGDIPYYPIPKRENYEEYLKYAEEAAKVPNLILLGRLAAYKYINMDVAVKNAICAANNIK
ncbi:MAG: UDP-galactopyranose mutase [Clostridia bacterium]|nr:UDP-galactopyranose mutase [Clostridia bacterium]